MSDLSWAIEDNDIAAVKSLLADDSTDVNARVAEMDGPLLVLAADLGHLEIVALLLDAGARIDDGDNWQNTACHWAVLSGHKAVVELLVARNTNLSLRNQDDETPLISAIDMKNEVLVMLLIDAAMAAGVTLDDETACLAATVSTNVIQLLLFKHRINLSTIRDRYGGTPLHQAINRSSDASVLKMLIEVAGVDVDALDTKGFTAAHIACRMNDSGALVCLIAACANLDVANNSSYTLLHYGVFDSSNQIACLLLAAGANVHAKADNGRTACHEACHDLSRGSLPALLAFGANLDEPDNDGVTPRDLLESVLPTTEEIETARRRVLNVQLSLVRKRAFEVCIGLQSLGLDALCTCEILLHSCGQVAPFVQFHHWWQIATKVKHLQEQ